MSGIIAAKIPFPSFNATYVPFIWSYAMLDVAVYSIRLDARSTSPDNRFSSSSLPSLTSGMTGPSIDICINVFTCSGSRRHLSDLRMRFSVEKDLSTPAVPMGINKIVCASTLNVGNITRLSAAVQRASKLSADDKSSLSLRNIFHSDINSSLGRLKILPIF